MNERTQGRAQPWLPPTPRREPKGSVTDRAAHEGPAPVLARRRRSRRTGVDVSLAAFRAPGPPNHEGSLGSVVGLAVGVAVAVVIGAYDLEGSVELDVDLGAVVEGHLDLVTCSPRRRPRSR